MLTNRMKALRDRRDELPGVFAQQAASGVLAGGMRVQLHRPEACYQTGGFEVGELSSGSWILAGCRVAVTPLRCPAVSAGACDYRKKLDG